MAGADDEHHHLTAADWAQIERDPEFVRLRSLRRRFVVPATIFFLAYYFALPLSVGFAPGAMSRPVFWHLSVAYVFALSQFVMAWGLLALYLLRARYFDLLEAQLVRRLRTRFR